CASWGLESHGGKFGLANRSRNRSVEAALRAGSGLLRTRPSRGPCQLSPPPCVDSSERAQRRANRHTAEVTSNSAPSDPWRRGPMRHQAQGCTGIAIKLAASSNADHIVCRPLRASSQENV